MEDREFTFKLPENGGVSCCFLGSTRSVKTTFLKYLLDECFAKHFKVLMSNSIHAPIYKDMKDIVKSPIYIPKLIREGYEINKGTNNKYDLLYILDDVISAKFDKQLLNLLAIHRNSNLSAIISIQSPILLNSATRGNLNYVFLGRMNSDEQVEKTIRMYLTSYLPGKMTEKIRRYREMTEDHHWIVIDNLTGDVYRTKIKI
jgi:hypothetical protein